MGRDSRHVHRPVSLRDLLCLFNTGDARRAEQERAHGGADGATCTRERKEIGATRSSLFRPHDGGEDAPRWLVLACEDEAERRRKGTG